MADQTWVVYLVRCADMSLYCGITTDLERRLGEHNRGTGAKYTRTRTPVTLVASALFPDRRSAARMEYRVKQQPSGRKIDFLAQGAGAASPSALRTDAENA
ncbi:GIY-YIG nuclease family protein [Desulfovibrio psychrotolerans]|uniref:UPF0213 protein n=1 Tax=Desulfovibrio psychrotolerans TaxID=415242 RepID=A0A7J0BWJ9_9BACT|nr:GIY-YIG nuclease family protein [Desulfovibrio psychrotolerans]GFM38073.1 UPF0213 protein [Desulfovibrio psychrotolerans]